MTGETPKDDGNVTIPRATLDAMSRATNLLTRLGSDPRTQAQIEAAVKVLHPEVTTEAEKTELAVAPIVTPIKEALDRVMARFDKEDADRAAASAAAVETRLEEDFRALSRQGYTSEGLEKIKGLMVDRNIADPYAAAALFDKQNPAPVDAGTYTPATWDLGAGHGGDATSLKELFTNEDAWAEKQIGVVLGEMRQGNR